MPEREGHHLILMKGAPDILIKRATSVFDPTQNKAIPLDAEAKAEIMNIQSKWSAKGQRVLLLARKYIPVSEHNPESQPYADYITSQAKDLEIVGLVGIVDPPRPEIPEVIRICRQAGIKVFMVSLTTPCQTQVKRRLKQMSLHAYRSLVISSSPLLP